MSRALLTLQARPLRVDRSRWLAGAVTLPGLAMAATHAPLALLTFGPLIGLLFVATFRQRYQLDRAQVIVHDLPHPTLELRYRGRLLAALDLRYARRHQAPHSDLLYEPGGLAVLLGDDPPPEAAWAPASEADEGGGEPTEPAELLLLRLQRADVERLRRHLGRIPAQPPPREDQPGELLAALGAAGVHGRSAEEGLRRHLGKGVDPGRPSALRLALRDLALRDDAVGAAARRVLGE